TQVQNNISPHVYAMDVNEGPVLRARENVSLHKCGNQITVIRSDGLGMIKPEYGIKSIIISGMGGNLIIDILKNAGRALDGCEELIVQPQSDVWKVRRYLHESGYSIIDEDMVYEDTKYYVIIKAVPGSERYGEDWEYLYGKRLAENKSDVFRKYLADEHKKNENIIGNIERTDDKTQTQVLCIEKLKEKNLLIEHILKTL
ncbi:MAG: class I SAM-dependent methyltransferase, partial [Lachnospiraceae bacterium]|nr:class I SAM-dependent methyltransferase [Lachnospiraceae bacterium]